MVKVIEKDPEDTAREERVSRLVDILNKGFGTVFYANENFSPGWVAVRERASKSEQPAFHIYPGNNRIDVYEERHLEYAVRLAKLYELAGEPEFTVKKDYKKA